MKSFIDNKNQPSQFVKPLKKSKKKKKAVWEGSKADKEMDKKQGFKEDKLEAEETLEDEELLEDKSDWLERLD